MITRFVLLPVSTSLTNKFEALFMNIRQPILSHKGCISLELLKGKQQEDYVNYFTVSQWEAEDALLTYLQSRFFLNTWPEIKKMLHTKAQAWTLDQVKDK